MDKPEDRDPTSLEEHLSGSGHRDLWSAIQEFRQTHDLSDLDIEEVYAGVRDPSPGRARR